MDTNCCTLPRHSSLAISYCFSDILRREGKSLLKVWLSFSSLLLFFLVLILILLFYSPSFSHLQLCSLRVQECIYLHPLFRSVWSFSFTSSFIFSVFPWFRLFFLFHEHLSRPLTRITGAVKLAICGPVRQRGRKRERVMNGGKRRRKRCLFDESSEHHCIIHPFRTLFLFSRFYPVLWSCFPFPSLLLIHFLLLSILSLLPLLPSFRFPVPEFSFPF